MGTPFNSRDLRRLAAWSLVVLAGGAGFLAWLAGEAATDLARGRERLLAGEPSTAAAAFGRARRWPASAQAARAGGIVAAAMARGAVEGAVPLAQLEALGIEALILTALDAGRLDAAASLATLARSSGHPLGNLYGAALAFDAGDERGARSLAASSATPLDARGIGTRLRRALEAKDSGSGVARLVLDRRSHLAASIGDAGQLVATPESAFLLAGTLERLGPLSVGPALRLTLDLDLSRLAVAALGDERGAIVIVETATGAVLAAVSDARTAAVEPAAAFEQRREPASIAKILTAAAAYRHGIDADEETKRVTCTGVERYGGRLLWCPASAGPLAGLDHALAVSCNVAFANLGVRLGAERLVEEYQRWGFDGGSDSLLGSAGRIHTSPRDDRDVADLAVGLELADITPLHAALLAATVANGGRMPVPALIRGACSPLGLTDTPTPLSEARPVLDPAIARRLRVAMEVVARSGTGLGLAPPGVRMAMKTGTAAEWRLGYHVNYIGMLSLPEPSLAFCVRVTNGTSSPAVTTAAREVTRRLLAGLAAQPVGAD